MGTTLHAIVEVEFAKLQLVTAKGAALAPEKYWTDVATVELNKDYELSSAISTVIGDVRAEGRAWGCYPKFELSFEAARVVEQDIQSHTRWVTVAELDEARELVRKENALTSTAVDALRAFVRVFADAYGPERVRVLFYSIT